MAGARLCRRRKFTSDSDEVNSVCTKLIFNIDQERIQWKKPGR